jgi:hypothetical protein
MAKAMSLLKAYQTGQVPFDGAFIISSFFRGQSFYSIYEVTAYKNVKDIFETSEGLTFKTDGNRTHMLIEPASFSERFSEPVHRDASSAVPYRFSEMNIHTGKRQERIMVAKEPSMLYSSFTILSNQGDNYSFLFFPSSDVYLAMKKFFQDALYNDTGMRKDDCAKASEMVMETIKKFTIWQG